MGIRHAGNESPEAHGSTRPFPSATSLVRAADLTVAAGGLFVLTRLLVGARFGELEFALVGAVFLWGFLRGGRWREGVAASERLTARTAALFLFVVCSLLVVHLFLFVTS